MIKKLFYPDFVPKPFNVIKQNIFSKFKKSRVLGLKVFFSYLTRYYYPRLIGIIITPLAPFLKRKFFLRLDLDHFGPILYPYYFLNSSKYCKKNKYYILEFDSRNPDLPKSFPSNFYFIKSPLMWLILGGFFFIKSKSYHIFPIYYNHKTDFKIRAKTDWEPLSRKTSDLLPLSIKSKAGCPKWLLDLVGDKDFVILFNRGPGCDYTAGNSVRNIELSKFIPFLESFKSSNIKVIRYGGSYMTPASQYNISTDLLIDYATSKFSSPANDIELWRNCLAVIGSPSGATHVPSVIFGKPTMYIGFQRIRDLISWHGLNMFAGTFPSNVTFLLPSVVCDNQKLSIEERYCNEMEGKNIYSSKDIISLDQDLLKDSINYFIDNIFSIESVIPKIYQHSINTTGGFDGVKIKIQKHGNIWIPK